MPPDVDRHPAEVLLALAASRPPTLGSGRLVAVDGPSGAGKTVLAAAVAALAPGARVVHLDELYDGWDGLPGVGARLEALLRPLAQGRSGSYRRYDWHAGAFAETVELAPAPLLVVEGVGAGAPEHADLVTALAWVDAPVAVRRQRGLARDGEAFATHWDAWAAAEVAYFARADVAARADLVVQTGPRP